MIPNYRYIKMQSLGIQQYQCFCQTDNVRRRGQVHVRLRLIETHSHTGHKNSSFVVSRGGCSPHISLATLFNHLVDQNGIQCNLTFGRSSTGQNGLFWPPEDSGPLGEGHECAHPCIRTEIHMEHEWKDICIQLIIPDPNSESRVIRVPLELTLSDSIPGASAPSLDCIPANLPWEIRLGALLLWASSSPCSSHSDRAQGDPWKGLRHFWSEYKSRFIPDSSQQTSLLLWSHEELEEIQVRNLCINLFPSVSLTFH